MNNSKKIFNRLLTGFFVFLATTTNLFGHPISLQLFTKGPKKIALVGVIHNTPLEEVFHRKVMDVIQQIRATNPAEQARLGQIKILLEAGAMDLVGEPYSLEYRLARENQNQAPFTFVQADIRERDFKALSMVLHAVHEGNLLRLDPVFCDLAANHFEFLRRTSNQAVDGLRRASLNFNSVLLTEYTERMGADVVKYLDQKHENLVKFIQEKRIKNKNINKNKLPEGFVPFLNFVDESIADANFIAQILANQQINNKTMLICGHDHAFGIIRPVLESLGYRCVNQAGFLREPREFTSQEALIAGINLPQHQISPDFFEVFFRDFVLR